MQVNAIKAVLGMAISGLLAYGFYSFHASENRMLLTAGSFVFFAFTLLWAIAVSFELPRTSAMVRVVSGIFFFVALASNLVFSCTSFSGPLYVITNGILFLLYAFTTYSIALAKQ